MKDTEGLYLAAKIKSDIIFVLMHLEEENGCTKAEAAKDLREIIVEMMHLEKSIAHHFINDNQSKNVTIF